MSIVKSSSGVTVYFQVGKGNKHQRSRAKAAFKNITGQDLPDNLIHEMKSSNHYEPSVSIPADHDVFTDPLMTLPTIPMGSEASNLRLMIPVSGLRQGANVAFNGSKALAVLSSGILHGELNEILRKVSDAPPAERFHCETWG